MISVAMATCDGERFVEAQMRSILEQLGPADEVVVADASSRDGTLRALADLSDPRIRILTGLPRGSIPATFEAALRQCRGEFIFLSDQDDLWLPGKLAACVAALADSDKLLVVHDARVVDASGSVLAPSFLESRKAGPGFWRNLWKPGYLGCAIAFRRALLESALPFPSNVPMHDWWLGLVAECRGGVAWLPEPLILHVRHGANANFSAGRSPYGALDKLRFRARLLAALRRLLGKTSS